MTMKVCLLTPCIGVPAVELGLVIGRGGRDIPESDAMDHIGGACLLADEVGRTWLMINHLRAGYALAIDMTARGLQTEAKNKVRSYMPERVDLFLRMPTFRPMVCE